MILESIECSDYEDDNEDSGYNDKSSLNLN